ncbi:MAG TPA: DUF2007 domain-containing protein [Clostridiaceae bacterium]|nr:DUF2007 domain-containing protein [Clostridiaceae bacterium]
MENLVLVFSGGRIEADLAKGMLESNNIPYWLKSEHGAGFAIRAGDILEQYFIYVNPQDKLRAEDILAIMEQE